MRSISDLINVKIIADRFKVNVLLIYLFVIKYSIIANHFSYLIYDIVFVSSAKTKPQVLPGGKIESFSKNKTAS